MCRPYCQYEGPSRSRRRRPFCLKASFIHPRIQSGPTARISADLRKHLCEGRSSRECIVVAAHFYKCERAAAARRRSKVRHTAAVKHLDENLCGIEMWLINSCGDPISLPYSKCCVVYLHVLFPPSTICAREHDSQSLQITDPCCQAPCVLAFSYWLSRFAYCTWSFCPGAAFTAPMYSLPHCSNW